MLVFPFKSYLCQYDKQYLAPTDKMDEKDLIKELKSGSVTAYRRLYEQWVSKLYHFVFHYVKSEAVTDDIVQETFLRIWTGRERLDPLCSFKSYLFTISYHLLLKELRRQLNHPSMEEYLKYQNEASVSEEYIIDDIDFESFCTALARAKQKLSPRQREIFEWNKEQDIPVADITKKLSISEQVVRNQLSAALKTMRAELQNHAFLLSIFLLNL